LNNIAKLFYGKQTSVRKFTKQDNSPGSTEKIDEACPFVQQLNVVEENNIYAAWEKDH
jgi:hypothetical protein